MTEGINMQIQLTLALKSEIVRDSPSTLKLLTFSTLYDKELETIKYSSDINLYLVKNHCGPLCTYCGVTALCVNGQIEYSIAFIIIYNPSPPHLSQITNYSGDQSVSLNIILR